MIRYSTNIFSSMILFGSESVSRQFARINLYEISHTSETIPKWKDLFNIWMLWYTKIFPVHWSSLVVKVFRRQFATINLYEISFMRPVLNEKICSTSGCYDIQQIFSVNWCSLVVKVFRRQFATINLYEISHTSDTNLKWKNLFNIWMPWY